MRRIAYAVALLALWRSRYAPRRLLPIRRRLCSPRPISRAQLTRRPRPVAPRPPPISAARAYTDGQQTAITTFVCNEVSNGNWAHLGLVAFAFGGSSNDVYNWITNTTMTFHGTITRNSPGWTGDGSTGYVDAGVGVGHSPASQNSASIGACVVNSRTSGANADIMGMTTLGLERSP